MIATDPSDSISPARPRFRLFSLFFSKGNSSLWDSEEEEEEEEELERERLFLLFLKPGCKCSGRFANYIIDSWGKVGVLWTLVAFGELVHWRLSATIFHVSFSILMFFLGTIFFAALNIQTEIHGIALQFFPTVLVKSKQETQHWRTKYRCPNQHQTELCYKLDFFFIFSSFKGPHQ